MIITMFGNVQSVGIKTAYRQMISTIQKMILGIQENSIPQMEYRRHEIIQLYNQ